MMRQRSLRTALVVVMTLTLLLGGASLARAIAGPEVKIGVITLFSGPAATQGVQQREAIAIAQEEINAAGGIGGVPVRFLITDSAGRNEQAISMMRKLIEVDKVIAVLGPFLSAEAKASFPVANRSSVPVISPSSAAPGIAAENRPWTFRLSVPTDIVYGPEIAKFKEQNPGMKSVVIFTDKKDFFSYANATRVYPPVLEKAGIKILDTITFETGEVNYSAHVTKAKQLNPDGVIIAALLNEGAGVLREVRRQGMTQPVVGGYGLAEGKFIELIGRDAEGMIAGTDFYEERPHPKTQSFVRKMRARLAGQAIRNTAASMYDAIYILKAAMEKGNIANTEADLTKDREKIRAYLQALEKFDGACATTSINKDGDAIKDTYVLQVKGGKFERIY